MQLLPLMRRSGLISANGPNKPFCINGADGFDICFANHMRNFGNIIIKYQWGSALMF